MGKKFKKTIENFVCKNCGSKVLGNGYTNHCPRCLWSKHVDVHPGNRKEDCRGMMKPVDVEIKSGKYILVHQCVTCGYTKKNEVAKNDDFDIMLKLAKDKAL